MLTTLEEKLHSQIPMTKLMQLHIKSMKMIGNDNIID